jgi:hypothetical protein
VKVGERKRKKYGVRVSHAFSNFFTREKKRYKKRVPFLFFPSSLSFLEWGFRRGCFPQKTTSPKKMFLTNENKQSRPTDEKKKKQRNKATRKESKVKKKDAEKVKMEAERGSCFPP